MLNAQEVRTAAFVLGLLLLGTCVRACRDQPALEHGDTARLLKERTFQKTRPVQKPD
jgi:hypothetical protein